MHSRGTRALGASSTARWTTTLVAVLALIVGTAVPALAAPAPAAAASAGAAQTLVGGPAKTSLAGFNAGNIISDAVFTDKSTMTEAQIQAFFNSKVKTCQSGYTCLKDLRIATLTRTPDKYCSGYAGASSESAARIILKVATSCGINPQVLIVMLQKEQGLVTHTYPKPGRYGIAMGFNCPDTAPCDPGSAGFFTQVYGAARQMQLYMEGRYFTWYAPGKTWNILYSPDTSCGRAPVYVANKATSALYYYTPYQPNAAALAAGYGEAKPCGAYGNRNFYNYFTDWFGSTQTPAATLSGIVQAGGDVWLISGQNRYHVTPVAYPEYYRVFGAPRVVDPSALTPFKVGPRGDLYVHDTSSGVVAMLQAGETHRFPSCELAAAWGGSCGPSLVDLADADFKRFAKGAEMTGFGRLVANGRIHQMAGASLLPLYDAAVAADRNGGTTPYVATFPAAATAGKVVDSRVHFTPGAFIQAAGTPEVWLPDEAGTLYHLPSWPHAAELGLPSRVQNVVPAADVAGYAKSEALTVFARCAGKDYVAAGGKLSLLQGKVPDGFTAPALSTESCVELDTTGPALNGPGVFVRFAGNAQTYHLNGGKYRPVTTAQQAELNGGKAPIVLTAAAALSQHVKIGAPYAENGTFVQVSGTPEVWLVDAGSLMHLPSWEMAAEYGLPMSVKVVSADAVAGLAKRAPLAPFATCPAGTYVAAGGQLRAVSSARLGGNASTSLSQSVCAPRTTGTVVDAPVFLGDGARTFVAVGGGFLRLPDAGSITRAAAGHPVNVNRVSAAYLDRLPKADVPTDGALVRPSNDASVTLISGDRRIGLPNWGVAADLGIQQRYQIVAPEAVAPRAMSGPVLSGFITCGSQTYLGARGVVHPVEVAAIGGFVPTKLSAAACSTLKLGSAAPIQILFVTSGNGTLYELRSGKLVVTAPHRAATVLTLDARTIAGMPKR